MYRKILIPLILVSLTCGSQALTDDGKKAAEELISSIKEDLKAQEDTDSEGSRSYPAKQFLRQLQAALARGNDSYIEQALENSGNSLNTEKSVASLARFRQAIKTGREQQAQANIDRLEGLIKSICEKILTARAPSDLDGLIDDLSKNQSMEYDDGNASDAVRQKTFRQLVNRLSYAKQFVTGWQNYLQAKKTGNTSLAVQSLQSLSSNDSNFIPRSKLLELIEQEKGSLDDASKIMDGIATLNDIQPAIKALTAAQKSGRSSEQSQSISDLIQPLVRLEKIYREFLAGLPFNFDVLNQNYDSSYNMGNSRIIQLRTELMKLIIPRYLDLPEGTAAKPDESIPQFMSRILAESKEREDVPASRRIIELQTNLRSNRFSSQDTSGLKDYCAAQNQINAGQYLPAVLSLQRALASGSDLLPAGRIGEQLAAIKKDHPTEYEQGMTEFLNPRPIPDYMGGMPYRGYDPRMRYPDGDPRQQGRPSVLLPVPAKESAAPAKAESLQPAAEKAKPAEAPSNPGGSSKSAE